MHKVALILLMAATLAGCAKPHDPSVPAGGASSPVPSVLAFDSLRQPLAVDPAKVGQAGFVMLGHNGAEPNIGITSKGSIFVSSSSTVMRSQDEGSTWQAVQTNPLPNSDPMLWVDPLTDRVYNAPMAVILACSALYISDDDGATWTTTPSMECGRGAYDHQKLATGRPGPAPNPAAGVQWPTVAYMCYNGVAATNCGTSYDGGATWAWDHPTVVNLAPAQEGGGVTTGCSSGQNGHPTAAPDGTVVYARTGPGCPQPFLVVSRDSGLTWSMVAGPHSPNPTSLDPEVAFTPDGTLYLLFQDKDFNEVLARSHDMGTTWDGQWVVSPPGVHSTSFSALAAGSDGRIAMGFLGTRDDDGTPSSVNATARWSLYIVASDDADSASPTFTSHQATPDDKPVQVGPIWQGGGGDPSRNLLDFIDGAVAPDGTFYVAYAEGCTQKCEEKGMAAKDTDSRSRETAVGFLRGWSLYAPGEGPAKLLK
jgi:hypothetical protein